MDFDQAKYASETDDKNEIVDACIMQLVDSETKDRFAGQWYQRLGLRICMRAEFGSYTCNWNDCLH